MKPPLGVRVLSAVGAALVFLLGLVVSFGAIVAAPGGIWLIRRRARRRSRVASRIGTLVGAVGASCLLALVTWSVLFAFAPRPSAEDLKAPPSKLPGWYVKAFPQSATVDSATERMVQSPGFVRVMFVFGALMLGAVFGVVGGALGWCASLLLGIALSARPPGPALG